MKKKILHWLLLSTGIMLLLPWLAVSFVRSDAGLAVVVLLFFGINPLFCLASGYWAGKQLRRLWWVPAADSGLFLAGSWMVFSMGEPAFVSYAGIYLAMGIAAMLIGWFVTVRGDKNG